MRLLTVGDLHSSFVGFRHEAYPADFSNIPVLGQLRFSSALKGALTCIAETATIIHTHGLVAHGKYLPRIRGPARRESSRSFAKGHAW